MELRNYATSWRWPKNSMSVQAAARLHLSQLSEPADSRSGGRSRGGNCSCVARAGCVSPKLAGLVGTNLLRPSSSGDRLKWRANSETCCTYVAWVCGERLLTCISSVIRRRRDVMNPPLRRRSFAAKSFPTAKPSGNALTSNLANFPAGTKVS